ncbi:cell wall-binding repeat-containing protein [Candidatus Pyrohabitans sp.]
MLILLTPEISAGEAGAVVVVSDNPFDLAVAQVFGEVVGARLIVLADGELNETTLEELVLLDPRRVYIVGGTGAVTWRVEVLFGANAGGAVDTVWRHTSPEGVEVLRFFGSDRYKTSQLVAREWRHTTKVFLVHGFDLLGLQKVKVMAKEEKAPIIYYNPYHAPPLARNLEGVIESLGTSNITLVTSPYITRVWIVSSRNLMRSNIEASYTINISPESQAEAAIDRAEEAIGRTEAMREELLRVYETRITPKARDVYTDNLTFQEARLKMIEREPSIQTSRTTLKMAKEAFNSSLYGEAFVLACKATTQSRKPVAWMKSLPEEDERRGFLYAEEELTAPQAILRLIKRAGPWLVLQRMAPPPPKATTEFKEEWEQREKVMKELQSYFKEAKMALRDGNETLAEELAVKALSRVSQE